MTLKHNAVYIHMLDHILFWHCLISSSRQEEDLRENHPFFDTPLFAVGRDSRFRKLCKVIVRAQYKYIKRDPITGKEIKSKYKQIQ